MKSFLSKFDIVVLHAVCIEKPNANSFSIRVRVDLLTNETTSIGCLWISLGKLEEEGIICSEKQAHKNNKEEYYFFPTKNGVEQDKNYFRLKIDNKFSRVLPGLNL